ncbi:MAG TPA: hypothetical protein VEI01_15095 [Terriglobales bacterium]|nr:hypothetical protein [Terriglobales bacterium]
MLHPLQVVRNLGREFSQLGRYHEAEAEEKPAASSLEAIDLARLVTDLYEEGDDPALRAAFALLEGCLVDGDPAVRGWAGRTIEQLHDLAAWKPCGREPFAECLGEESSRVWSALNRICRASVGSDFHDASVFEAELARWHAVREAVRLPARVAA